MSESRRRLVLLGVMLSLLAIAAAWSYGRYGDALRRARDARADTDAALALGRAIERLRQQPTLDGGRELGDTQLTSLLYESAAAAALDPDAAIQSIGHQPPRNVPGTHYSRKSTELRLRDLTLEQLTRFLHHLESQNPGLKVSGVHLTNAAGEGPAATWNVEPLVLSYLIYTPGAADERRAAAP